MERQTQPNIAGPRRKVTLAHRRWQIAWLLGVGVLINYFDRVNLSVSYNSLFAAFGISDVIFGYLSSAYNWTYAICQLPVGVVLDRLGVRRVGRIGTLLWSLASFAAAATPNLGGLFGARLLLGVGEAPTFPANAKAVGAWFPAKERSLATSMFDAAAKFAPAIGVPLLGSVLVWAGWRWSFALTGAISMAYFLVFWLVYRDPAEDEKLTESDRAEVEAHGAAHDEAHGGVGKHSSLFALLRQRKVLGLTMGFGAYNYVFFLLLTWLPRYLSSALHVDLLHSFLYTGVPWLIAATLDVTIGGWLVDHLIRRGGNASLVRRVVLTTGMTFGLGILGTAYAHTATQALIWISISIGGLAVHAPVAWSVPSLIAVRGDVGKVGGIANFSGQISGICASILTGYLVSSLHSYFWAFGVAAIYLGVGILGYVFLLGPMDLAPKGAIPAQITPKVG